MENLQIIERIIRNVLIPLSLLVVLWCIAGCIKAYGQSNTCVNGDLLVVNNTGSKNNQCIAPGAQPAGTGTTMIVANDTVTGTTLNKFAKLTGAPSKAIVSSNGDTSDAIGIVTSGAGVTGNATITILGQVSCVFDGATTAGNYVTIAATGGGCHDAGSSYPTSGATYGRVLSTNGAGGTFVMELMTPDIAFQNAGNGKSKPGTPANSYQYNSSNTFAGGTLQQASANVVEQLNSTNAQTFSVYKSTTNNFKLSLQNVSSAFEIASSSDTTPDNIKIVIGTSKYQFATNAFTPPANQGQDLGASATRWSVVYGTQFNAKVDDEFRWNGSTRMLNIADGWFVIKANSGSTAKISLADTSSSAAMLKRNGTALEARLGDDSAYGPFAASNYRIGADTIYSAGTPSIAGNGTLNTGSKDSAGKITTTGTGASTIVLTFSITFTRAPACMVVNETTANLVRPVSTTTTLTINATIVSGDSIAYICTGY